MTKEVISNSDFIDMFVERANVPPGKVVLPHERAFVERAIHQQKSAYDEVVEEKIKVSGGDDWHDGAFIVTDNQAKIISQRMSAITPFIDAPTVEYPENDESRATLGSRIIVVQNDFAFPVDIVGFREGYPEDIVIPEFDDEVMGVSPESPIARAIIGKVEGEEVRYMSGDSEFIVILRRIDQLSIREYFMSQVEVVLEVE